ncbi:hypothetical protein B0T10DRAFT_404855, partial [Thelonectria olida]
QRQSSDPTMSDQSIQRFDRGQVTQAMLEGAARLFSEHYGVWGQLPSGRRGLKPGNRVKMSADLLRAQCLPDGSRSCYARIVVDGVLAGNAFVCRWTYGDRQVCWVTQLVVHTDYRERRLATALLIALQDSDDDIFGIMSSHPAACKALVKGFGNFMFSHVRLGFAEEHAASIMKESPIAYVKNAKLRGSLFSSEDETGLVCGVDSDFYVDHEEPLKALSWFKAAGEWPLGELPDGYEFLLLFDVSCRRRSPSPKKLEA